MATKPGYERMPLSEKVLQAQFLAAYIRNGAVSYAAEETGIEGGKHNWWMEHDAEYPMQFEIAKERSLEVLEREARRRAVEGYEQPVYQGGVEVAK